MYHYFSETLIAALRDSPLSQQKILNATAPGTCSSRVSQGLLSYLVRGAPVPKKHLDSIPGIGAVVGVPPEDVLVDVEELRPAPLPTRVRRQTACAPAPHTFERDASPTITITIPREIEDEFMDACDLRGFSPESAVLHAIRGFIASCRPRSHGVGPGPIRTTVWD